MLKGTHFKELPSAYLNRQFIEGLVQQNDEQRAINCEQKKSYFTNQQQDQGNLQMTTQELQHNQDIISSKLKNAKLLQEDDDSQLSAINWMKSLLSSTYNQSVQYVLSEKCREIQSPSQKGQFDSKLLDIHILRCQLKLNNEIKQSTEDFQSETAAVQIRHRNSQNNNKCKTLDEKIPKPVSSSSYAEQSKLKKLFYLTHNSNNNNHQLSQTLTGNLKSNSLTRCRKNSISKENEQLLNTKRLSPCKNKEKKNNCRSISTEKQKNNCSKYPTIQGINHSQRQEKDNNGSNISQNINTSFTQNNSQTQNHYDSSHNQSNINYSQNELRQIAQNAKAKDIPIYSQAYISQDLNTTYGIQNCSKSFESIDISQHTTTNPYNTINSSFYQSLLNSQQQRKQPAPKVSPYQQQQQQHKEQEENSMFNQEDYYFDNSPQQHLKQNSYHQTNIPISSLTTNQQKLHSVEESNKPEISQALEGQQMNNNSSFLRQFQSNLQQRGGDQYQQSYLSNTSNNSSTFVGSAQEAKLNSGQQISKRHMRSFSKQ